MAKRSKISQMPVHVREWLEDALVDNDFSEYKELEALLKEKGYDISHSSIHRYGQKLERRLSRIQAATQAAELVAKKAADKKDNRSSAVNAMLQTGLFEALMDLEDADGLPPAKKIPLLTKAAQGFAKLGEASIKLKRYQEEVEARLNELASKKDNKGEPWLSQEQLAHIKKAFYGI